MKSDTLTIAKEVFAEIGERFPMLRMIVDEEAPVELSVTIPVQEGLKQKVWLCLQNDDELHFSVGHFWQGWFPCTDPKQVRDYVETVWGYLSGKSRILEHYRGNRCIKAQLQTPRSGEWRTIATWSRLSLPIPWRITLKEISNT